MFLTGNEWNYVILSTVRSIPSEEIEPKPIGKWFTEHLGVVGNPHQIIVALTRAKYGLIIVGEITES